MVMWTVRERDCGKTMRRPRCGSAVRVQGSRTAHCHQTVAAKTHIVSYGMRLPVEELTERSILTSFLLLSCASRSMPTRSRSSYCRSASSNSSLAARMAASSFSSVVRCSESPLSFFGLDGGRSRSPLSPLSLSLDLRPSRGLASVFPEACRDFSACANAHGICAEMSSCDARHRA